MFVEGAAQRGTLALVLVFYSLFNYRGLSAEAAASLSTSGSERSDFCSSIYNSRVCTLALLHCAGSTVFLLAG